MITLYFFACFLVTAAGAGNVADLVGTWSTKSRQVLTGQGFYDYANDKLIEPNLTGISFSFSADGHYEEAFYRAIANPQEPSCPKGIMQWQHGTYSLGSDGSLHLTPIAGDGRQLLSDPCYSNAGIYTRYNQTEVFQSFTVSVDPYNEIQRLDLFGWDGAPMNPMYLVYRPPLMLPTTALDPKGSGEGKRHVTRDTEPSRGLRSLLKREELVDPDHWMWVGILMSILGGATVFFS